ncbi:hypothetical protein [uncultured Sphingomonas sp.]|uniref:hypothetical protein n=1 Tax=uncultured Sphingomonas sp. TaxID=158754 RepID=UPI0025D8689A|nr:hypothetical protein [uncultured Sphingomonas sp.]
MRELSFVELCYVAGGGQQTSEEGPWVWGGDPGAGGGGGAAPPPVATLANFGHSAQEALQAFMDELSYTEAQHNDYVGSSYDHDIGGDASPWPFDSHIPVHDPGANAQYWRDWNGDTDPETLRNISANQLMYGSAQYGSFAADEVAIRSANGDHLSAYVNGIFYDGTYHSSGTAPTSGDDIVVTSGPDHGYWTFNADFSGISQANLLNAGLGSVNNFSGIQSHASGEMSHADKQNAIDLLKVNAGFHAFKLNGMDIEHDILKALDQKRVVFVDGWPDQHAETPAGEFIFLSSSFKSDPIGTALVLAHEGLHAALANEFGYHGGSIYEEALGKLVTAYAFSGLNQTQQNSIKTSDPGFYSDTIAYKSLSDQGNFSAIMDRARATYGAIELYPLPNIYNVIKGSF